MIYSHFNTSNLVGATSLQALFTFTSNQDLLIKKILVNGFARDGVVSDVQWHKLLVIGQTGFTPEYFFNPPSLVASIGIPYTFFEYSIPSNEGGRWVDCGIVITSRITTYVGLSITGPALVAGQIATASIIFDYEILDNKHTIDPVWTDFKKQDNTVAMFNPIT